MHRPLSVLYRLSDKNNLTKFKKTDFYTKTCGSQPKLYSLTLNTLNTEGI